MTMGILPQRQKGGHKFGFWFLLIQCHPIPLHSVIQVYLTPYFITHILEISERLDLQWCNFVYVPRHGTPAQWRRDDESGSIFRASGGLQFKSDICLTV